jgi:glycosyltransferase involved in cell wall biosynthesis
MQQIVIDIEKTKNLNSGLGQFSLNYALSMQKYAEKEMNYVFYLKHNKLIERIDKTKIVKAPVFKSKSKATLWHSLHQFPKVHAPKTAKHLLTVHDLNFLHEKDVKKQQKYLHRLQSNIDKADAITVISDYTKKQLLEHVEVGEKPVYRIYNGVDLKQYPTAIAPSFIADNAFFFSLGIISEKKNFHVLLTLLKAFPNHKFVFAGEKSSVYAKNIQQTAKDLGVDSQLIMPGTITEEEKSWLYTHCEAFLFPSLAEGFGLPVIEAMLATKPVFLSTYCSLPEVGGDAAFYWDSFDADKMIAVLKKGLKEFQEDKKAMQEKIKSHANLFSHQKSILAYIEVYRKMMNNVY